MVDHAPEPPCDLEVWEDRYVAGPGDAGVRLDRFLATCLQRGTRSLATRIIRDHVQIDGRPRVKAGTRLRAGDRVRVRREEHVVPGTPPADALRLVARHRELLILDKPAGLLVHRTAREGARTAEAILERRFPGERVEPAHRLDRDTAGCLLAAQGADAVRRLRGQFAAGAVGKGYLAVVEDERGRWQRDARETLDTPLGPDEASAVRLRMGPGDLPCQTHVVCVGREDTHALLAVTMTGGRQHQIRAHLHLCGTPVVGDKLYGAGDAFFLRWIDAPGHPALVAELPIRFHALVAASVSLVWGGAPVQASAAIPPLVRPLVGSDLWIRGRTTLAAALRAPAAARRDGSGCESVSVRAE